MKDDIRCVAHPLVVGITGGIGSGKSYVAHLLQDHLHVPVYDSDTEAKKITATHPFVRESLQKLVGNHVYATDGTLQKTVLAEFLFSDDRNAAQVNAIIHPVVKQHFAQWIQQQSAPVVAIESAILYESGFNKLVHRVLFVDAPTEVRLQRAMRRDGADARQIKARMDRQQTLQYKNEADWVLQNESVSDTQLLQQLTKFVAEATQQQK